jgi:hypothetical protein
LIPEFERATQSKVVTSFGGDDIPKRLGGLLNFYQRAA